MSNACKNFTVNGSNMFDEFGSLTNSVRRNGQRFAAHAYPETVLTVTEPVLLTVTQTSLTNLEALTQAAGP